MRLQVSFDRIDLGSAFPLLEELHDVADIIEIGTPFIFREGMHAVLEIRKKYPKPILLADMKIMDGGNKNASMAFDCGADIVTVLAVANDSTLEEAVKAGQQYHREIYADMIAVWNLIERAKEIDQMGVDYIGVHTGKDLQTMGKTPVGQLGELTQTVHKAKTAVAGGINVNMLPEILIYRPEIIICGQSILSSTNPRKAALEIKEIIRQNG